MLPENIVLQLVIACVGYFFSIFLGFTLGVKFCNKYHNYNKHFKNIYDYKTNSYEHLETLMIMKDKNITKNYEDFLSKDKLPDTPLNSLVFLGKLDFYYLKKAKFSDRLKIIEKYTKYLYKGDYPHSIREICMFLNEQGMFR